jgi:hypothetical protein
MIPANIETVTALTERTMKIAVAAIVLTATFSLPAHALPWSNNRSESVNEMVLVADSCGKGNHRNNAGQCVAGSQPRVGKATSGPNGLTCPPGTRLVGAGRQCRKIGD